MNESDGPRAQTKAMEAAMRKATLCCFMMAFRLEQRSWKMQCMHIHTLFMFKMGIKPQRSVRVPKENSCAPQRPVAKDGARRLVSRLVRRASFHVEANRPSRAVLLHDVDGIERPVTAILQCLQKALIAGQRRLKILLW